MTEDGQRRTHRWRARTSSWNAPPVRAGTISRPKTGGSIPSGRNGRSTARGATSRRRTRSRSSGDGGTRTPRVGRAAPCLGVRDRAGAGGSPQGHLAQLGRAQEGDRGDRRVRDQPGRADRAHGLDAAAGVRDGGGQPVQMTDHRWYAIQTTAGHENKVRSLIDRRIKDDLRPDEEKPIRQALVPTQEGVEIKKGKKGTVERKIYPGYVLGNMVLNQETIHVINGIQGVIKFVMTGQLPMRLCAEEVNHLVGLEQAA